VTELPAPLAARIAELNLAYLLYARELVQAGEGHRVRVALGICDPLAEWLARADLQALTALAQPGVLLFQPRLSERAMMLVLARVALGSEESWIARMHAALAGIKDPQADECAG